MSRNFRQAQLLDAFDFDGNEHLRQLAEGFTNIRSGVGTPTITANDGELFYDTRGMFLYVREGGSWIRAGSAADIPTISSLLDTLSYQTEYTYGSLLPADYMSASGDAFHDGAFLTLVFRIGYEVPETLYGFTTPPGATATTAEPDIVIQQRNPGINFGGFQQVPFIILKGVELIPQFELGRNIPTILNTLYTRTATTGIEYLTKTATGTYEFTVPPEFEDTNTEYTFADGTNGTFTVTPSDTMVAQTVSVGVTDSGTQQTFNISQTIAWSEANPPQAFAGVTTTTSGAFTFASETDAARFFSDLGPETSNGGFVSTVPTGVIEGGTLLAIIPPGTTVVLSGTMVTLTGITARAVTNAALTVLTGVREEGRISNLLELPVSAVTDGTGNNVIVTVPNSNANDITIANQVGVASRLNRVILTNQSTGSHAFYRISSFTAGVPGTTDAVLNLTAIVSYTANGISGFEGRTPAFSFTRPTTGTIEIYSLIDVQARDGRFTSLNDTPATYEGRANQTVRVNSTGTGLEFVEVAQDPVATITAVAGPTGNTVDWTPQARYSSALFGASGIVSSQTVANHTFSSFTGTAGQLIRTSGNPAVVPREMSLFLAEAINNSGITITDGDYYTVTFPTATVTGLNGQIAIFRARQSGSLPTVTGAGAQTFLNDNLGGVVVSATDGGDIPFTITRYTSFGVDAFGLENLNSNAVNLAMTSGSQTISLLAGTFSDATPTINSRIAAGTRIFVRIDNSADDTYLEILDATAANIEVNLGAKFTVNGNDRTGPSTDTRRIILDPAATDNPVHNELYEHRVVQVAEPAIVDLNGAPVFAADITATEVKDLLDIELQDLDDVNIIADESHYTQLVSSITGLMGDADYIVASRTLELFFSGSADRAPYIVGNRVAFTANTVALADIPSNILFTGRVSVSASDPERGEVVDIIVDERYAPFFNQFGFADGAMTERGIPNATALGWRVWNFLSDDAGVAVVNAQGDLSNQSIFDFRTRLGVQDPLPFRVVTSDSTSIGTAYPNPSDPNDFNIQYQREINTLFVAVNTSVNIPIGTTIGLRRTGNSPDYTFVVTSFQNFGDLSEFQARPANDDVDAALNALATDALTGITIEGTNVIFNTLWSAHPSTSEHILTLEPLTGTSEFTMPWYSGSTLPNTTGVVDELFVLTGADGSNTIGIYQRNSATDITCLLYTSPSPRD